MPVAVSNAAVRLERTLLDGSRSMVATHTLAWRIDSMRCHVLLKTPRAPALAAVLSIAVVHCAPTSAPDRVRIDTGELQGAVADSVASFKGIPYAAPPVDSLRWRPPQPVQAWPGTRDATKYGALCMQDVNPNDNGVGPGPASEDCLTLNVWTPVARGGAALPVMVWIHGGGYVNGSGTAALYDGTQLAKQGVVVVTINYRLGRFGFFAHPALTKENPDGLLGNYGLMDQIAALKWVRRNIGTFGGDSADVTIFGESAGGGSVLRLMISPMAKGLFEKAVVESGLGRERMARLDTTNAEGLRSAEAAGKAFMDALGDTSSDPAELRAMPAADILSGGNPDLFAGGGPIIDGKVLTMDVDQAFKQGIEAKVPLIIGTNSLEFPVFNEDSPAFKEIVRFTPPQRAQAIAVYGGLQQYREHIVSDLLFTEPARYLARQHAEHGQPVYLYRFSVVSPSVRDRFKGAVHASERQYVFRTLGASPWPTSSGDSAVARTMSAYWTTFAGAGDPNGDARPDWPRYTLAGDSLLNFTNDGPVAEPVPDGKVLDFIAAYYGGRP
ncbi:MAG: carboxylesterase family protein [Gemmatimonadota bacterium]|jgi:para-nitrobenzyl esterase